MPYIRARGRGRAVSRRTIQLILAMVDVYLGSLNGIDLLQRLKAQQPGIYPVIMTANVSVETAARALSEGAIDYVSKPLTVEQVRAIAARADGFRGQRKEASVPAR